MSEKVIIVMGVSGCGKTTIGKLLSGRFGIPFYDADDFHPIRNVEKMQAGIPLNDDDREPWLNKLSGEIKMWAQASGAVLACSALKEKYRRILRKDDVDIGWIFLNGSFDLIFKRMEQREDHYMPQELLRTQCEALEVPTYGIHIDIEQSPEAIVNEIISKLDQTRKSEFGVIGLGVMGSNISLNIAEKGIPLSVYNRPDEGESVLVSQLLQKLDKEMDVIGFTDIPRFFESLQIPRKILIMVKSGHAIDRIIDQVSPFLSPGDILIDGGNSHFQDTSRRQQFLSGKSVGLIGCGISGGEKGARFGPSIMPGGVQEQYEEIVSVFESIAAKDNEGFPCCTYIGPGGAGHFVKMVHNGIEYAEMQLLAEVYHLLSGQMSYKEMADLFEQWNKGDLQSYLLEITIRILRKTENGQPILDLILDQAGNKGTGGWSVKAALDLGTVNTMMSAAVFARYQSSHKENREKMAHQTVHSSELNEKINSEALENAYRFARILNHHQGFELLRLASEEYDWSLPLHDISRIWTNGCIIRSDLMEQCASWLLDANSVLNFPEVINKLNQLKPVISQVLKIGMKNNIPLPVFTAALNDWVSMTSKRLPANLIQAQRDYFGAHRYQRNDAPRDKFYHTNWN